MPIIFLIPPSASVRRVAAPYGLRVNKFVQISQADDISHYSIHSIYYIEQSETTPQSWLSPSQLPLHKGAEAKFHIVIKFACEVCFTKPFVPL